MLRWLRWLRRLRRLGRLGVGEARVERREERRARGREPGRGEDVAGREGRQRVVEEEGGLRGGRRRGARGVHAVRVLQNAVLHLERVRLDRRRQLRQFRRPGADLVEVGVLQQLRVNRRNRGNLLGGLSLGRDDLEHLGEEVDDLVGDPVHVVDAVVLHALAKIARQVARVVLQLGRLVPAMQASFKAYCMR